MYESIYNVAPLFQPKQSRVSVSVSVCLSVSHVRLILLFMSTFVVNKRINVYIITLSSNTSASKMLSQRNRATHDVSWNVVNCCNINNKPQLIFFIGKAKNLPYFYFRFMWPTDLEIVPRVEPPTLIISTKFEVDTTIHRRATALLVRIRYVKLWPWPLTLDLLNLDSGQTWLVTWSTPPPSLKILRLYVPDLWNIMMSAIAHR